MASSGSKSVTVTSWDTLKFSWAQVSQSIPNNTTTISWTLQLVAGSSGRIISTASKDWSVTVNGTTYSGTNTVGVDNNETKTLASGKTTIAHNADGSKSFSYSFSQEFGITFSGVGTIGTKSGSGTGTLNTIPRATQPTLSTSSADMGATVTISTPRASSAFTHDLAYSFAGGSYVSIATGVTTSYSWTVPDLASKIPNTTSGTVTVRCITKNGSTTIGTKTVLLTAKVPTSVVPTISNVATAEATSGLAAQFGAYIQNKSTIKTTITAAGAKGSTIKSYSTTFQGKTYTGNTWTSSTVLNSGNLGLTTTVTDSRGRTAKKTTTINVLAYTTPRVTAFSALRVDGTGAATEEGTRASVSFAYSVPSLGGKNTANAVITYKRSTTTTWSSAILTLTDLSKTGTELLSPTFSIDYQFDIRLQVTDWFGATSTYTVTLPSGAVIMDIKADGTGLSFFKTSERSGVEFGSTTTFSNAEVPKDARALATDEDLNNLTSPGFYVCPNTATSATILNKPTTSSNTFRVEVYRGGYAGIVSQRLVITAKTDKRVWERDYYGDTWGAWYCLNSGNKILWSGAALMVASSTATLSEKVSAQSSGIVLVFSIYDGTAAVDQAFYHFFVSKAFVAAMAGKGSTFTMFGHATFSRAASKYLYIHDDKIVGNDDNTLSGTAANGITWDNSKYVLRYVIGV